MPGDCPASLHLLLFLCGKHSAPSRKPFRQATKTVRNHNGIVFSFRPESRSPSTGFPTFSNRSNFLTIRGLSSCQNRTLPPPLPLAKVRSLLSGIPSKSS